LTCHDPALDLTHVLDCALKMSHVLEHHHCGKDDHSCPPAFVVLDLRL
jgi:hypothetical protein